MDIEQLPKGCGYMGNEFGSRYLDASCYGGRLYDEDNCDNDGNLFEPNEYIPCPNCNLKESIKIWSEEVLEDGYFARANGKPRRYPYKRKRLKHPKAYRKLRKAWLKGWDAAEKECNSYTPRKAG